MRQFGYVQTKPCTPYEPKECERGESAKKYSVKYSHSREYFDRYESHVVCVTARGSQVSPGNPNECTVEYTEWYKKAKGANLNIPRQPKSHHTQAVGEDTIKLKAVLEYIAGIKSKVISLKKVQITTKLDEALQLGGFVEGNEGATQPRKRTRGGELEVDTVDVGKTNKQKKVQFAEEEEADQQEEEEPKEEEAQTQVVSKKRGKESSKGKQAQSSARTKKK